MVSSSIFSFFHLHTFIINHKWIRFRIPATSQENSSETESSGYVPRIRTPWSGVSSRSRYVTDGALASSNCNQSETAEVVCSKGRRSFDDSEMKRSLSVRFPHEIQEMTVEYLLRERDLGIHQVFNALGEEALRRINQEAIRRTDNGGPDHANANLLEARESSRNPRCRIPLPFPYV